MFEPFDGAIPDHEDVEANAAMAQLRMLLQQQARGGDDAPLLVAPDAGGCAALILAAAHAYFGDDQQVRGAGDDVELADTAQEIACHDREPLRLEECAGAVFRQRSRLATIEALRRCAHGRAFRARSPRWACRRSAWERRP
jgi:hypothetical protein